MDYSLILESNELPNCRKCIKAKRDNLGALHCRNSAMPCFIEEDFYCAQGRWFVTNYKTVGYDEIIRRLNILACFDAWPKKQEFTDKIIEDYEANKIPNIEQIMDELDVSDKDAIALVHCILKNHSGHKQWAEPRQ